MRNWKHYTSEEIEQIKELYPTHYTYEIAKIMGRTAKGIGGMLERLGLSGRPPTGTLRKYKMQRAIENKYGVPIEWLLETMHWVLEMPIRNGMDTKLEISTSTITEWMNDLKIPHRSISEDNHRRYSSMTVEQIKIQTSAANENVRKHGLPNTIGRPGWSIGLTKEDHPGLMASSLKHRGDKNPMWDVCGKDHPRWAGGKIWWRGKRWDRIKQAVKERDGFTCQHCRVSEADWIIESGQPLQVHHLELYRVSKNNSMDNLITLCNRCHTKADAILLKEYKNIMRGQECTQKKLYQFDGFNQNQFTISP